MIDREDLRRRLELAGYDAETIALVMAMEPALVTVVNGLETLVAMARQFVAEAAQSLAALFEAATDAQQAAGPAKLPRPPRDTRPKNMAAYRTPRPARVARSSCRKMRR